MKVVVDTDIGDDVDDALALALILSCPELELVGVSTVYGDTETRARLAKLILKAWDKPDIPVAVGEGKPLDASRAPRAEINQAPALREAKEELPPLDPREGHKLLAESVMSDPGNVTVLTIGAMTNLALALREEPALVEKAAGFVSMAGVIGQKRAEWNVMCDSAAAEECFSKCALTMVGLDVTTRCQLPEEAIGEMEAGNDRGKLLRQFIDLWRGGKRNLPTLHDPLAAGLLADPTFCKTERGTVSVDRHGHTNFEAEPSGNVLACVGVDAARFVEFYRQRVVAGACAS